MTEWIDIKERTPTEHGYYDVVTFGKPSVHEKPVQKLERLFYDGKGIGNVILWKENNK